MKLTELLKFRKEIFFFKFIILKPFDYIGKSFLELSKIKNLLIFEMLVLFIYTFRYFLIDVLFKYPIHLTNYTKLILIVIFLTFVFDVYRNQSFEDEYKKEEINRIKDGTIRD